MAYLQMNLMSQCLMRPVSVTAIVPSDKIFGDSPAHVERKLFKTLYLLHGVYGAQYDWLLGTNLMRYAELHDLAVIMPAGENRFYVDQPEGHNYYGEFIGRELVELTRALLPLSDQREDTFIGGLSMGGYGALRNGLKYHETFGRIAAFSSALITDGLDARTNDTEPFIDTRSYAESCFGDLSKVEGSDMDVFSLAKVLSEKLEKDGRPGDLPKIFMACGTGDDLLSVNRKMRGILEECGYDLTYHEAPGEHNWDFWNEWVNRAIDWLPLTVSAGINSGNISL